MSAHFSRNLAMLTDFYELTMSNGYLSEGKKDTVGIFDLFFRRVPDDGGFAIMCGLKQIIEYITELSFNSDDIAFLKEKGFNDEFLNYLSNFSFTCDVWAIPEGTPIFPNEPVLTVKGPIIEAQLIETLVLITFNHQSLIATKANRIVRAAQGRPVVEFGARRAQGYDAAIYGARAAIIGGCASTSCVLAAQKFGLNPAGTMAHSWIQMFDNEYDAFAAYARIYPDNCTLLVDTYNVLKSGIKNAIKVFDDVLKPLGKRPVGIRIDSGDITYLSKRARKMLDEAGYPDCHIVASNSLDEHIISDMLLQGAKVDTFGVGERLITSASSPVMGGVYKLSAIVGDDGEIIPKIKLSENVSKITTPGFKSVWRLFDRSSGKAIADVVTLFDEEIDDTQPYEIFDPEYTWKRKIVTNFIARRLTKPIFKAGKLVYTDYSVDEIQRYCQKQVEHLWDEVLRFENPHDYYVDLSNDLWNLKHNLIKKCSE
ncbi:MAG: nicotinate phosphoribosyltransferase [Clostridia bacterium]|nr:nicotinate phosphoribosyltransferase [Clostridia bacterium]